ncbi:hypothetical protein EDB85DRAFT_256251 [Lactarius pseudohatsudake]|nr:hypothetical protein EDB85DRAFT_256251 [Lactarius pseudohatsudake]
MPAPTTHCTQSTSVPCSLRSLIMGTISGTSFSIVPHRDGVHFVLLWTLPLFVFHLLYLFDFLPEGLHFALFFVLLSGFATVVVAHESDKVTQKIAIDADLVVAYLFVTWLNPEGVG